MSGYVSTLDVLRGLSLDQANGKLTIMQALEEAYAHGQNDGRDDRDGKL